MTNKATKLFSLMLAILMCLGTMSLTAWAKTTTEDGNIWYGDEVSVDVTAGQIKEMRSDQSGVDIHSELGVAISPFIGSAKCPVLSDGFFYKHRSGSVPRRDREPAREMDTRRKPPNQFSVHQSTSSVTVNFARSIKVQTVPPSIVI